MKNYLFQIIEEFDATQVQRELEKKGLIDTYLIEEAGAFLLGGRSSKKIDSDKVLLIEEKATVNWESQWELFANDFHDGKAHIDLSPFGTNKILQLLPGPGFGDLSHPTSNLCLKMMIKKVAGQRIIDIGTGSGILALAAILLGAKESVGIDIDSEALKHARKNAKLNQLSSHTKFLKKIPRTLPKNPLFLMNMIIDEQKNLNPSKLPSGTWIVSGVLRQQKNEYLTLTSSWGWKPMEEHKKEDWMGWIFKNKL